MSITKAIIPIAGYGTRRLPITKAIEKCMLPIGNRPTVDYVVEDCLRAGITDIIFVVGEDYEQVKRYYTSHEPLESHLVAKGKQGELERLRYEAEKANYHFVVQDRHQPYGTAVPVSLCREVVTDDEQVLVLMGDDFIFHADGSSEMQHLISSVAQAGVSAGLLAVHIPQQEVSRYGVIETYEHNGRQFFKHLVEQPKIEDAPTDLINISKYVFDKKLLQLTDDVLRHAPAANGEYQITEALNSYVAQGHDMLVVPATGDYLDSGTLEGWLRANNQVFQATTRL